jgi:hypothetical protein
MLGNSIVGWISCAVAKDIAEKEAFVTEFFAAIEQQPAGLLQDRITNVALHAAIFLGRTSSTAFVHIGNDVEAVEDVQALVHFSRKSLG